MNSTLNTALNASRTTTAITSSAQKQQQTRGFAVSSKHKKFLKLAKGYRGRAKSVYKIAIMKVEKGLQVRSRKETEAIFSELLNLYERRGLI
jgi:ribosomal protein L20